MIKPSSKVTLKDIAEKTGYSINTVSRALKSMPDISVETRNKILKVADQMCYIGNSIASSLRSGSSRTIAIIVGDISNPHFATIIRNIVNIMSKNHYNTFIYNTCEKGNYEQEAIRSAIRQNVDGILICPTQKDKNNIELLKSSHIPFVLFGRHTGDADINSVVLNDVLGGYIATKHLLELGCRNIAFINAKKYISSALERLEGYKQALTEFGVAFQDTHIMSIDLEDNYDNWENMKYQFCHKLNFDGIVAFSDIFALRIKEMLKSHDFRSVNSEQIPIVSFDNIVETFPLPISMTSISHADSNMSIVASQLLLDRIKKKGDPNQIVLNVKLYLRN